MKKKELSIAILLIVLCVFTGLKNHQFLGTANVENLSGRIGMYGIFSIGAGLVIITGGIDLSVGSVFALQAVVLSLLLVNKNHAPVLPWPLATLLAMLLVAGLGLIHALLIAKLRLQAFIVTLCGLLIYRGVARVLTEDGTRGFIINKMDPSQSLKFLYWLATGVVGLHIGTFHLSLKMPFIILLVIAFLTWILLHHSVYGRYLYAVGRNEEAARFSGIKTEWVIGGAYVLNMILVGIASIIHAVDIQSIQPGAHGSIFELYAIAAAVLGGCSLRGGEGSIIGIVLGTALLQLLRNLVNLLGWPSQLDYVVTGGVILAAVMVDQLLRTHFRAGWLRAKAAWSGARGFPVQPVGKP
jgi:ribose transport system permease protein